MSPRVDGPDVGTCGGDESARVHFEALHIDNHNTLQLIVSNSATTRDITVPQILEQSYSIGISGSH